VEFAVEAQKLIYEVASNDVSTIGQGVLCLRQERCYVLRLRLHGRDFDFGNTPEAAVSYTRCIGEMRSILLQRKVANPVADRAIFRTLQAAVDSQFAQLRQDNLKSQNANSKKAGICLARSLRQLRSAITKLPPSARAKLNSQVTALLGRSEFDTEVFIDVIDTIATVLPALSPRRNAEKALKIVHPAPDLMRDRRSPMIDWWETMPATIRREIERTLSNEKPSASVAAWLDRLVVLLNREAGQSAPQYSAKRQFISLVASLWRDMGLRVGLSYKFDLIDPEGVDGGRGGLVKSRFQRYCDAALRAFKDTYRVSARQVGNAKKAAVTP